MSHIPPDSKDYHKRLLGQVGRPLGIVAGMFGVLFGIGRALLPHSTLVENMLIVFTCLALAAASLVGLGAWRSVGRFTITMVCVVVALTCLAALSIVAESAGRQAALAGTNASATGDSGATTAPSALSTSVTTSSPDAQESAGPAESGTATAPSPAPPPSRSPGPPRYLADLQPAKDGMLTGKWTVGRETYAHSLGVRELCAGLDD